MYSGLQAQASGSAPPPPVTWGWIGALATGAELGTLWLPRASETRRFTVFSSRLFLNGNQRHKNEAANNAIRGGGRRLHCEWSAHLRHMYASATKVVWQWMDAGGCAELSHSSPALELPEKGLALAKPQGTSWRFSLFCLEIFAYSKTHFPRLCLVCSNFSETSLVKDYLLPKSAVRSICVNMFLFVWNIHAFSFEQLAIWAKFNIPLPYPYFPSGNFSQWPAVLLSDRIVTWQDNSPSCFRATHFSSFFHTHTWTSILY